MDQPLTAVQQTSTNMNQPSEPTPLPRSGFSAEVIVAIFTVTAIPFTTFIAYIYAQAYQVGFCKYFEIPNDYISLSSFMILSVSWGFAILLALTTIAILLILYLIVSTYGLLLSLPPQHQERGFLDRLYAVWHRFPVVLRILVMVMVISFAAGGWVPLFNKWGEKVAEKQEWFSVVDQFPDVPEVVVLRVYGDYLITAKLDRSTNPKSIERTLYLLKMSDISKVPLRREMVGRLIVKPPTAPQ